MDVIEEIKLKLEKLRELDTTFEVFGSSTHRYILNPVVDIQIVCEFERRYGCELPEVYRNFLLKLGNGGAGPSYGLFPLGIMDDGHGYSEWGEDFVNPIKGFKFEDSYNDNSMLSRGAPEESSFESASEYELAYDEWMDENYEELQMEYWLKHSLDGAVPICHHGCAYRSWLVVAEGTEYGNIWQDDTPDEGGVYPEKTDSNIRVNFGSWYLNWLDKSLREITDKNA